MKIPSKTSLLIISLLALPATNITASQACDGDYKLIGSSSFSVWFWDVYEIELKTQDGSYTLGHFPLELALTYKRDIDKEDLIAETKNQWERYQLDPEIESQWLAQLDKIWPSVKENDRIAFRICDSQLTKFYFNDKPIGEVSDKDFAKYFSLIWLDPNGPYPKQVKRLTGNSSNK